MQYRDLKITNFTCNGKCSGCGQCCGDILHLSKQEIKRIDQYLKKNKVEATPKCILFSYDNTCPFRDNENKKCKIYDVRPKICQSFKCDRAVSTILKERDINQRNAYWNQIDKQGNIHHMTSFDLLFYNDPKPLLQYITSVISGKNDEIKYGKIIEFLKLVDLGELADSLSPVYEKE